MLRSAPVSAGNRRAAAPGRFGGLEPSDPAARQDEVVGVKRAPGVLAARGPELRRLEQAGGLVFDRRHQLGQRDPRPAARGRGWRPK
jgi:hypothetical protein